MKISKRTGIALFFVALFSSFIMQYPLFKYHAGNWDHYFIMFLSNTISKTGGAPWIANWSSYFGLHKTSYPQGAPFLISFFQQLSGEHSESLILVYSYIEGSMAVVFSFALGLVIRKKDYLFAFFLSFLFATAPTYLYASQWTASARGLFITLLPLFVMFNIFIFNKRISKRSMAFLNVFFLIILFSIHRMAFFVLITAVPATIITYFLTTEKNYGVYVWYNTLQKNEKKIFTAIMLLFFISIIFIFYSRREISPILNSAYTQGTMLSGNSFIVRFVNLSFTFAASGGILVPFVLLPFFSAFRREWMTDTFKYMIIFFLFSLSFIVYSLYFRAYDSLIFASLIALSFVIIAYKNLFLRIKRIRIGRKAIVILLVSALIFSSLLQAKWDGWNSGSSPQWTDYREEESVISASIIYGNSIFVQSGDIRRATSLYSNKLSIPPGNYEHDTYFYLFSKKPEWTNPKDLNLRFSPKITWGAEINLYSEDYGYKPYEDTIHNLSFYDYFEVENSKNAVRYFSSQMVTDENYKIYDNRAYSIYIVDKTNADAEKIKVFF